jgi:L-rhamnose isomerase
MILIGSYLDGHLHWDTFHLFDEIVKALEACAGEKLESVGLDTWGVDFALLDSEGEFLEPPYCYRDSRTGGMMDEFFMRIPREKIYQLTGMQFLQLNTLYQLFAMVRRKSPLLKKAKDLLFMPDIFNYLLTGEKKTEFTIATTSQLYNPLKKSWDEELFAALGISTDIMQDIVEPASRVGKIRESICRKTGLRDLTVIAPATHDTGSAIAAVPAQGGEWAYISSGTWSLMGIEVREPVITEKAREHNFTNEGGVEGTFRFLKNIMGLWLLQGCRNAWGRCDHEQLARLAADAQPFKSLIDPDSDGFFNPPDMPQAIRQFCKNHGEPAPESVGETARCVLESLALKYRAVLSQLREVQPRAIKTIHIIGGRCQNKLLYQMTADATGLPVVAGPVEATAVGNLVVQAMALGHVKSLAEARAVIGRSFEPAHYEPRDGADWDAAFERFKNLSKGQQAMPTKSNIEKAYEIAKERYASLGVNTDKAIGLLKKKAVSLHCWQADDVGGFETPDASLSGGGIVVSGKYPGKARNIGELRQDLEKVYSMIPGRHRLNLHAIYGEFRGGKIERDKIGPEHFAGWVQWAKKKHLKLDFNATLFSHPKAASGFTLSSRDKSIRRFWIEHVKRCRAIGAYMGKELAAPCIHNLWVPDGSKDLPADRWVHRSLLKDSLDDIYSVRHDAAHLKDSVESKLFGIGSEAYVVGSHEFYMAYAISTGKMLCLDMGHFHPTESIADKISAILQFSDELLLHVSRGVRWDSDHVVILNDDLKAVTEEIVRGGALDRVHIALDFFDASINRVGAYVIGTRALLIALLIALLEPTDRIKKYESEGDNFARLALMEEAKAMPFGAVWDYYCAQSGVPVGSEITDEVKTYEKTVLSKRS